MLLAANDAIDFVATMPDENLDLRFVNVGLALHLLTDPLVPTKTQKVEAIVKEDPIVEPVDLVDVANDEGVDPNREDLLGTTVETEEITISVAEKDVDVVAGIPRDISELNCSHSIQDTTTV